METTSKYEDILKAAQKAAIKDTKLDKAVTTSWMPSGENVIAGWDIAGNGTEFAHLRLMTDRGGIVTVSNLVGSAHLGEEAPKFTKSTKEGKSKNMLFLKGQRINPTLPSDQAKVIAELMGKTVTHSITTGLIMPFRGTAENPDYTSDETEALKRLTPKDFYKIKIV